jgi:type IV secretion system protein VirB9
LVGKLVVIVFAAFVHAIGGDQLAVGLECRELVGELDLCIADLLEVVADLQRGLLYLVGLCVHPVFGRFAVAAGDTVRWIIGDTVSGSGARQRVHILVKPTRPDLTTNLVINTDRRTYHLELRATPTTYMASVSWTYPQDRLIALRGQAAASKAAPIAAGVDINALNFRYEIEGDRPPWRPLRAFDDSRQVFIEFPADIAQSELPPLFVVGAAGDGALVNYRVRDHYMVVDRLFAAAELRLGDKKSQAKVRIVRSTPRLSARGRR